MQNTDKIRASFDNVLAVINGEKEEGGFKQLDTAAAVSELESVFGRTILPRRITISSEDGARLSVIARNRRVIKIADVHPQNLWQGQQSPQATVCEGDYDSFARAFASALLKVVEDKRIAIEQTFLPHALGTITHSGYPASMLCEHVALSKDDVGDAAIIQGFYDSFPEYPRARFGSNNETDIPASSHIDPAWFGARVSELRDELADKETDLRFVALDGADRRAAAIAWFSGEGCIVLSERPDEFEQLELRLSKLRERL